MPRTDAECGVNVTRAPPYKRSCFRTSVIFAYAFLILMCMRVSRVRGLCVAGAEEMSYYSARARQRACRAARV